MIRGDPVSRYLTDAMSALPTPFARLVYLASMKDHYTAKYLHDGWISVSSPEEVNAVLRQVHRQVFEFVAMQPLLDLCKEVRKHFESLGETEVQTARLWLETEPYYLMIPVGYPPVARKFFISQFRLALEILIHAPKWDRLETETSVASLPPPPDPGHPLHWLN
jgi:hypothetical protein